MHKISEDGLNLIKKFEGFSSTPYKDVAGKLTIGYGHLIIPGEEFTSISEEEATEILENDVKKATACVNNLVRHPISQNEADALISFAFNLGCRNLQNSTLLRMINSGNIDDAADEFLRWNRAGGEQVKGLTNRRIAERGLFLGIA